MGIKDRLLLAVLATVAVALVAMTIGFNLVLQSSLTSDADQRLYRLADDESKMISVSEGGVSLPRPSGDLTDLGSQVWVFVAGQDGEWSLPSTPTSRPQPRLSTGSPRNMWMSRTTRCACTGFPCTSRTERDRHDRHRDCPWLPTTAPRG